MPLKHFFIALALTTTQAQAGVPEAWRDVIHPGLAQFEEDALALEEVAQICDTDGIKKWWNKAFDSYLQVGDWKFGPTETAAFSLAFWPDARGFTYKALTGLAKRDVLPDAQSFAESSVAGRGFFALEAVLYNDAFAQDGPDCDLISLLAQDIANQATALKLDWETGFSFDLLLTGHARFQTDDEAFRAIYTQLLAGLEFTADQRLGRPLGSFDRPRPNRAEAIASGRSLRHVRASVDAAQKLAHALADHPLPLTDAAADRARAAADRIADPAFQSVTDPAERLKIEILQQEVRAMKTAIEGEIGARLGLSAGFNSSDGD